MNRWFFASIKEKDTELRRPVIVFGEFKSREEFIKAIPCPEEYDLRTLRWLADGFIQSPDVIVVCDVTVVADED